MDDEKRRKVRQAALEVFLRYGYRKVTMDDIAQGVGISRPALYLVFPNKEAVFRDVVQAGLENLLEEIERGLAHQHSLADQLAHVFQVSSVQSFELVSRAPAASELMNASFDFVKELFDSYERRQTDILARLIRAAVREPDALQPSAHARARIMISAAHGFKSKAKDVQEMKAFIGDLVRMTVAGLPIAAKSPRRVQPRRSAAKRKTSAR